MKAEKERGVAPGKESDNWLQNCLTSFDAATGIRVRFAEHSEPPLPPEGRPTFCRLLHLKDPDFVASCARFHAESRDEARHSKCAIRRECPCGISLLWAPVSRQEAFFGFLETEPLIIAPESGQIRPIFQEIRSGGPRTRLLLERAFRSILTATQYRVDGVLLVLRLLADHIARGLKEQELFAPAASASLALAHRAEQYMRLHFTDPLSTSDLAEKLHVSKQHLCRAFQHEMGETILQFLAGLRADRACELLHAHPELNVAEIALASGFQSIPRFYSVFHTVTGKNPTLWREERKIS
jgi:AraC-like DNA-binding protein